VKPLQDVINAAFAPEMTGNVETGQPAYVALEPGDASIVNSEQPSAVALPAPFPYGVRQISNQAVEKCLPAAIAAYADWLIRESGWTVRDPETNARVPIASQHIAILFRRFLSWGQDITREYVHELESRNIPHFLWGARSFHQREEVETVRVALNAIEWPDDELSVYATLRGALFAISDNTLLSYKHRVGSLHPFHPIPEGVDVDFLPLADTLRLLADLHRRRNRRSIVETLNEMLETARAHAAFALRPSGNQALANVYRIAELARAYEAGDGYSFRGFVEQLNARAEQEDGGEAPVLEEGAEGVRIMTVHAAKGLEFPIVILADMTANIAQRSPEKHIDAASRLCAVRVAGCSPWDLIDHEEEEHARDLAEGVRVAYVAATRARDLLVIPAVGDAEREGWIAPLNKAIYPPRTEYRAAQAAPSCPKFGGASVLQRPVDFDGTSEMSVKPGLHANGVVWWDPGVLGLHVEARFGLRGEETLSDDAGASLALYAGWKDRRQAAIERGTQKKMNVFLATDGVEPPLGYAGRVQIERVARLGTRPSGPRFGTLVHLILRDADFGTAEAAILQISRTHARLLNAPEEEITAAAQAVFRALGHPLLERARRASKLYRELPVVLEDKVAGVLEAVIDLAFVEDREWHVVDFKTDAEDNQRVEKYRRQVGWYTHAIDRTTGATARGWILHI
jgi:ATP-dependent exoDNAse (exonuclease V) beta subunit